MPLQRMGTGLRQARFCCMKPHRRIVNQPVILMVEDEPLVRLTQVDILREAEIWVIEAQDADEAFELLKRRPDIRARPPRRLARVSIEMQCS